MVVESENPKSSITTTPAQEDQSNPNPNPNPNADDDLEEGEIIGGGDDSSTIPTAVTQQPHPLEHSWTFWFDNPSAKSKQAAWGSSMRSIYTFATVEEFWSLYNNINHPSKLVVGADFIVSKWTVTCQRGKSDTCWLYTLLALIGEQFEHGDEICGAVVNVRSRQEKVSLWTKNAANEASQVSIGEQWKKLLDYNETIGFIVHDDAKHDRAAKNRYTI
ncbi:hypothetical protein LWI29_024495 [Acer saccharum]|uniref:Eukaryotic translation initiation factor 4E-1 n=1 Tax=Acer saccharum TaxID=4024 RepID=A0AA39RSY4_ACESA|nr:hypothetical protein LWI29_024495 [Acer saccharum]